MKRLILTLTLGILCSNLSAQLPNYYGATWSFGRSILHEQLPESYAYRPISILGYFPIERIGKLSIYGEYQFSQASNLANKSDLEFGLNIGLQYHLRLASTTLMTAGVGSGPHYITVQTDRQASGYIFSDNFELNVRHFLTNFRATIQIAARFRHISNAGFKSPNGGIDNFFLLIGLEKDL